MKNVFAAIFVLACLTASFGDASGHISFIPSRANVGTWGPSGQNAYYWVLSPSNTFYNLGLITDAAAKAKYATVLAAMANGKVIEIGIWALTYAQLNISGGQIFDIPEYVSMIN